ncbi:unnamed protein product [Allacma fusca]|uniref:Citrate transport protein n=1 Tax=Allacma fusca TaxID=39272 RepID=A0A8J2LPN5_9HEXA|nr:unnamed protein product [Allacma fusca]
MENTKHPFRYRPWLSTRGAASAAAETGGLRGVIAGGVAGGIEILITYPAEYVKTQLQLDDKSSNKKYNGFLDCVKKTLRARGFFGLYSGISILLYGAIPKSAIRFGSFETLKKYSLDSKGHLSHSNRLLCGMGTGVIEAFLVVIPKETIKVKFINDQSSSNPKFHGVFHGIKQIVRAEGIGGLYQGVLSTIIRQATNVSIRFYIMETLTDEYTGGNTALKTPKLITAAFGSIAGAVSALGNAPVDVVKTRMQGLEARKYKGNWDCIVKIWSQEGAKGFYKGSVPRLIRASVETSIIFVIYESLIQIMKDIFTNHAILFFIKDKASQICLHLGQ